MRKALVLLAMVTLVIWLARGAPVAMNKDWEREWVIPRKAASEPQSCCIDPAMDNPHWECVSNTCMLIQECGYSVDCSTCGCNPDDEWNCIEAGGNWDPNSCSCSYVCDPDGSQAAACESSGGTWDQSSCSCGPCANPETYPVGPPYEEEYSYCDGEWEWDCEGSYQEYQTLCNQEVILADWVEYTEVCVAGDYCGDPCGGDPCCGDPYCGCYWDYCS